MLAIEIPNEYLDEELPSSSNEPPHYSYQTDNISTPVFICTQLFKGYLKADERKLQQNQRKRATSCIVTVTLEMGKIEKNDKEEKKRNAKKFVCKEIKTLNYLLMKVMPKTKVKYHLMTICKKANRDSSCGNLKI